MTIGAGLGLANFPFENADQFWEWVDLCDDNRVTSIWQSDRISGSDPFLECMSVMAALAGLILVGYLGYADQEIGTGYDLDSIAAVAVGGAVLGGGKGRISGTIAGVVLMAILLNLVLLLGLKVEYQLVIRGLVILAAVAFYSADWKRLRRRLSADSTA